MSLAECYIDFTHDNEKLIKLVMQGNAAGYIFECHIDMKEVMGVARWHSTPIRCLRWVIIYIN